MKIPQIFMESILVGIIKNLRRIPLKVRAIHNVSAKIIY